MTAQRLRYKKSIAKGFNLNDMLRELEDFSEACDNVRWCIESDEDELIEALDGDKEEAFELRVLFSEVSYEAEKLYDIITNTYITEYFDTFFAAVAHGSVELIGYDSFEDDYYSMTKYEEEWGAEEAGKRLMRLTKKRIARKRSSVLRVSGCFSEYTL